MTRCRSRLPSPRPPRWLRFDAAGQTVCVRLAHVRQVQFTAGQDSGQNSGRDSGHDAPSALVWSAGGLWEIADPAALAVLRAYVREG